MSRLIMGVDGGGTKSHLALFDEKGKCVNFSSMGPLNHESMDGSYEELEKVLPEFLLDSIKKAGASIDDLVYSVFGLAGVDTKWQHEFISGIIRKAGFKDFTLCNDAFLGVAAGCPDGAGICAINGTGSSMAALDYSGNTFQLGGLGALTDDCGGSYWFGEMVLGTVYNSLFKYAKPTLMKDMVFEKFDVTTKEDLIEKVIEKLYVEVQVTDINRFAFNAAAQGDEPALDIIKRSAEHYAGGIACLINQMDFPGDKPVQVAFAGSVFVKEKVDILPKLIKKRVDEILNSRPVEFYTLDMPPVAGAVLWAARGIGFDITSNALREGIRNFV